MPPRVHQTTSIPTLQTPLRLDAHGLVNAERGAHCSWSFPPALPSPPIRPRPAAMSRLTADLVIVSPQFTNALKDREIDLRGTGEAGRRKTGCSFFLPSLSLFLSLSSSLSKAAEETQRPELVFSFVSLRPLCHLTQKCSRQQSFRFCFLSFRPRSSSPLCAPPQPGSSSPHGTPRLPPRVHAQRVEREREKKNWPARPFL